MTTEEITKLAEEYAEEVTKDMAKTLDESSCLLNETKRATKEYITNFMQWILRTHRIVERRKKKRMCLRDRSKVCDLCHECDIDISQPRY